MKRELLLCCFYYCGGGGVCCSGGGGGGGVFSDGGGGGCSGGTHCTRVGTLIVATIYLQLIQNTYMFRGFTVLQCSQSPVLCTTRCQRCGSRRIPLAALVVLIVRMERSTA